MTTTDLGIDNLAKGPQIDICTRSQAERVGMKRRINKRRKIYKTLVGSHKKAADAIYKLRDLILTDTMIAIDPGSNSLGFAVFEAGVLVESGVIAKKGAIGKRLKHMITTLSQYQAAVVVTEFVRTSTGHVYLTWASGAAVGALGADHTIEIHTGAWKKLVTASYQKTDENDAISIGRFAVEVAKET